MKYMKTIRVVAAIIEREGKILIARRMKGEHAGLWEFPGGKYEEGESGEEALKREIREEFDATIEVRELLCTVEHAYDSFYLVMDCFVCSLLKNSLNLHDHSAVRWIDPKEEGIEWVPADRKVIRAYLSRINTSACRKWYEGDPILEEYHDHEWCRISHDDRFQFEMLTLEGASVGLSWSLILHKRENYRRAFHNFEIDACADMSDRELEVLLGDPGLIRNRNKIFSVRKNARAVKAIQKEFGSFDAYLWSFSGGEVTDGHWKSLKEMPAVSELSVRMSKDMKKRGISFMGPVITYSFLQAVGIVNDHLEDCSWR